MKNEKTILTIVLFVLANCIYSQPQCANKLGIGKIRYAGLQTSDHALAVTLQEVDKGIGVMYANRVYSDFWLYGSLSHGSYWVPGTFGYIPHNKFAFGVLCDVGSIDRVRLGFSAGISGHDFYGYQDRWGGLVTAAKGSYYRLNHVSGEFGVRSVIMVKWGFVKGIWVGVRRDVFRTETNTDIGLTF